MSIFSASLSRTTDLTPNRGMLATLALAAVALFGGTGCMAEVQGGAYASAPTATYYYEQQPATYYDEPVVYVQSAPVVNIEAYPRVYYRGSYVYYVDGRWYYPSQRGWVYYRNEPRALITHRVEFERRYPRTVVQHRHAPYTYRNEAPSTRVYREAPR